MERQPPVCYTHVDGVAGVVLTMIVHCVTMIVVLQTCYTHIDGVAGDNDSDDYDNGDNDV